MIDEVLKGSHAKEWNAATDSEYDYLMANAKWDIAGFPKRL